MLYGAVLAVSTALGAAHPADQSCKIVQLAEFKVSTAHNRPELDGKINGQDVKILIDTGSSFNWVWGDSARALSLHLHSAAPIRVFGIGGEASTATVSLKELQIGAFAVKNLNLVVLDTDRHRKADAPALVLGEGFFAQFTTEFDLANGVIRLLQPEHCQYGQLPYWAKAYTLATLDPVEINGRAMTTSVIINGKAVEALLDTGSVTSAIARGDAQRVGFTELPDSSHQYIYGVSGRPVASSIGVFDMLSIGEEVIKNVRLRVADLFSANRILVTGSLIPQRVDGLPDMLLGADFFRSHRILADFEHRKLLFTYNGGSIFQTIEPEPEAASEP